MKLRRIFAAVLLAALALPLLRPAIHAAPAGGAARVDYLAPAYKRVTAPKTTLGPIPAESLYCINDTMTVAGLMKDSVGFTMQIAGAPFTYESTGVFSTGKYTQIVACVRAIGVGGDTSGVVRLGFDLLPVLSDTVTAGASWDTLGFHWAATWNGAGSNSSGTDSLISVFAAATVIGLGPVGTVATTSGEKLVSVGTSNLRLNPAKASRLFAEPGACFTLSDRGFVSGNTMPPFCRLLVRCLGYNSLGSVQPLNYTNKPRIQVWLQGIY